MAGHLAEVVVGHFQVEAGERCLKEGVVEVGCQHTEQVMLQVLVEHQYQFLKGHQVLVGLPYLVEEDIRCHSLVPSSLHMRHKLVLVVQLQGGLVAKEQLLQEQHSYLAGHHSNLHHDCLIHVRDLWPREQDHQREQSRVSGNHCHHDLHHGLAVAKGQLHLLDPAAMASHQHHPEILVHSHQDQLQSVEERIRWVQDHHQTILA